MDARKNTSTENKPQPSLIPIDLLIKVLEPAYREGITKYERDNWRYGFPVTMMMDAAMRHLCAFFYDKEDFDSDAEKVGHKKHHLGGALFSIICMYDTFLNYPEKDDRGTWKCEEEISLKDLVNTIIDDHNLESLSDYKKNQIPIPSENLHAYYDCLRSSKTMPEWNDEFIEMLKNSVAEKRNNQCLEEMDSAISEIAKKYECKVKATVRISKKDGCKSNCKIECSNTFCTHVSTGIRELIDPNCTIITCGNHVDSES